MNVKNFKLGFLKVVLTLAITVMSFFIPITIISVYGDCVRLACLTEAECAVPFYCGYIFNRFLLFLSIMVGILFYIFYSLYINKKFQERQ